MGRRPCCAKEGLNRGAWSVNEDNILINYIKSHGEGKWRDLPHRAGLKRCGKSCRLRWLNYLRPNIKRGNISEEEEELIVRLHKLLGNRWALIAGRLPGRTDNEIKNYWNTNLSKRAESRKIRKQRRKELGRAGFVGNRSMVSRETHRVIRTKPVRCLKAVFPQPGLEMEEEGHGVRSIPTGNENPPSSPHRPDDGVDDFLLDFNIDELLVPDFLVRSDPLLHVDKGTVDDREDITRAEFRIEDVPPCLSPVPDPSCETFDFSALSSFLTGDDDGTFAH